MPGPRGAYWSSVGHDDAAAAVVAALGIPAGIYNVCDDDPVTRQEFADVMAAAAGSQGKPRPMPRWLTAFGGKTIELLSRSQRMSNRKLKEATGWAPKWPSVREAMPAAVNSL